MLKKILLLLGLLGLLSLTSAIDIDSIEEYDSDNGLKGNITRDLKTDMFTDIIGDLNISKGITFVLGSDTDYNLILEEGSKLFISSNRDVAGTIKANNADLIETSANADINAIEGTLNTLKLDSNNEIVNMNVVVDNLDLGVNGTIKNIVAVVKNNLNLDSNNDIEKARIYVYNDLNNGVNGDFAGKLTVFGNLNIDTNGDNNGNICVINKTTLGVNADLNKYVKEGLYGNIYPLLNINYDDNSSEAKLVESKSKEFDSKIKNLIEEIKKANNNMYFYKKKLTTELKNSNINEYNSNLEKYNYYKAQKQKLIDGGIEYVNKIFGELNKYIQQDEKPLSMYNKVKTMYIGAVKNADLGVVASICSNNVIGDTNSSYTINGNEIEIGNVTITRKVVIKDKLEDRVENILKKKDDDSLLRIKSKLNTLVPVYANKGKETMTNAILDINTIIDNVLLYEE